MNKYGGPAPTPKATPGTTWTATNFHSSPHGPAMPRVDPLSRLRKKRLNEGGDTRRHERAESRSVESGES